MRGPCLCSGGLGSCFIVLGHLDPQAATAMVPEGLPAVGDGGGVRHHHRVLVLRECRALKSGSCRLPRYFTGWLGGQAKGLRASVPTGTAPPEHGV